MAKVAVTETYLTNIANAIRGKNGSSDTYTPAEMATAITNIPSGEPTLQSKTKTYTPTTSQQTETVVADSGYDGLSQVSVTVNAMPSGTAGTPTASKGTVSNHAVTVTPSVTNTAGYIAGGTKTGTGVSVSASELVSGTYSVTSSGTKDVTNYASASVPSGTAGTPTATKGTVSNHAVSVTPSVTNTTGFITGSTKTGTAVSVSASELVSGSETKTENGTYDVTNLAELVVDVSGGGGGSNYTLLASKDFTYSTTTTSATTIGTISAEYADPYKTILFIKVTDKSGKRNGYFFGTITLWQQPVNSSSMNVYRFCNVMATNSNGVVESTSTSQYGIYPYTPTFSSGRVSVSIRAKYNSSYSKTIDGTYSVELYALQYPNNVSPYA